MTHQINSVAVLGTGTMGAGIAALCANAGRQVLFLDLPAAEGDRNAVAAGAFERMQGGKSPMLKDSDAAQRITIGNFDDDLGRIADCDWIVEVIVEDLAIKRDLFARIEASRGDGSIVTTNTSGIMLHAITEGMPERLRRNVAVTHFFNPVLVMKLVEVVPGEDTDQETIDTLAAFLGDDVGKGVVWAKDTVNFVANRIGCFWMLAGMHNSQPVFDAGLDIEDIDAIMSAPVGIPPTGLYGLLDLVGLDVMGLVSQNLTDNLPADDPGRAYASLPARIQAMLDRGQVGRKAGGGFYRMTKDADGNRLKETFDLGTGSWRDAKAVELTEAQQNLHGLMTGEGPLSDFARAVLGGTALYAAGLVGEIADDIVNIDRAMRWGFAWRRGPFELLDDLGPEKVIARLESEGKELPKMLHVLKDAGAGSFYRNDGTEFLGLDGAYHPVT